MDVEAYLESPEAERDVAALLALWREPNLVPAEGHIWEMGDYGHSALSIPDGPGYRVWHVATTGAWTEIEHEETRIYFRPEGDRYVVSDLGDAVRVLRLHTGRLGPIFTTQAAVAGLPEEVLVCGERLEMEVPAADLPRAIVRVMLAAYRVSRLEVGSLSAGDREALEAGP